MGCPRCSGRFRRHSTPRGALQSCTGCGGIWLDNDASQKVVQAYDDAVVAAAEQDVRAARTKIETTGAISCPTCAKVLERVTVGAAGVELDICREHGTWFDPGELQRVVRAIAPRAEAGARAVDEGYANTAGATQAARFDVVAQAPSYDESGATNGGAAVAEGAFWVFAAVLDIAFS